jgi:hypothetical protein
MAGIVATVFLTISFLSFLHITQAFREDMDNLCNDYYCAKLLGNENDYEWGPGISLLLSTPLLLYEETSVSTPLLSSLFINCLEMRMIMNGVPVYLSSSQLLFSFMKKILSSPLLSSPLYL